jgi:tRNA-splicing ligase RtcB
VRKFKKLWIKEGQRIPVLSLLSPTELEEECLQQAANIASLDFVERVVLLPDAHSGYAMPIGGVMVTKEHLIPYAVGVDIGCGMVAARTTLTVEDLTEDRLSAWLDLIEERVPLGFDWHKTPQNSEIFKKSNVPKIPIILEKLEEARYQLGTLGGGNHFIEVQKDGEGNIWIMIHSGSRHFGHDIASHYQNVAKRLRAGERLPGPNYSYLSLSEKEGEEYLLAMKYAMKFARENRERILNSVLWGMKRVFPNSDVEEVYNAHHNYAEKLVWKGEKVLVTRKGSISAQKGEKLIIPGSMGTSSFICVGLGCEESVYSSSHGAGRRMSRVKAITSIPPHHVLSQLSAKGITLRKGRTSQPHTKKVKKVLKKYKDLPKHLRDISEEAPQAYKDVSEVISIQEEAGILQREIQLEPIAVIKG